MNISKTGIQAQQKALRLISNNIANASTQGYKAKNMNYQSLISNEITETDRLLLTEDITLPTGVRSQQSGMHIANGSLHQGSSFFDLAVKGDGFFGVQNAAGDFYLTKDGSFSIDGSGQLVNGNGDFLVVNGQAPIVVENPQDLSITAGGTLIGLSNGQMTDLGTISIYLPNNIQNLRAEANNYYSLPEGDWTMGGNGNNIDVSYLEMSNVDLAKEFTDMIVTQRAYALNVKVAQTTDEIKTLTNQFS